MTERIVLHGGRAVVAGRCHETSLYDLGMATYDTHDLPLTPPLALPTAPAAISRDAWSS